jgi:hypothetical protein
VPTAGAGDAMNSRFDASSADSAGLRVDKSQSGVVQEIKSVCEEHSFDPERGFSVKADWQKPERVSVSISYEI